MSDDRPGRTTGQQPDERKLDEAREAIKDAKRAAAEDQDVIDQQDATEVLPTDPPSRETGFSPS
ncbi:hypothetical protein [Prauserella muralis]|nr:hypothetical protein [Prauserella muralis]TWE27770.1 hypothetical protein FHX69_0415 [Prauserella muralis]